MEPNHLMDPLLTLKKFKYWKFESENRSDLTVCPMNKYISLHICGKASVCKKCVKSGYFTPRYYIPRDTPVLVTSWAILFSGRILHWFCNLACREYWKITSKLLNSISRWSHGVKFLHKLNMLRKMTYWMLQKMKN